jgi:hypothetical protein
MKHKKTQVIGCRIPFEQYQEYEIRCIEMQIEMSEVLRKAVNEFMRTNKNAQRTKELLNNFALPGK